MKKLTENVLLAVAVAGASLSLPLKSEAGEIPDIGTRRELFVDDFLIDKMTDCELELHKPVPREVVMVFDKPWEGNRSTYCTVFKDGEIYRMYYGGMGYVIDEKKKVQPSHEPVTCYAESKDGIHWTKPEFDLFPFKDAAKTNIVFMDKKKGPSCDSLLIVFKDENPECAKDAKYKALLGSVRKKTVKGLYPGDKMNPRGCLLALKSPDGIHWNFISDKPLPLVGRMDSQNLAFWDSTRKEYRIYYRTVSRWNSAPFRDVSTAVSKDFINWSKGKVIDHGAPKEQLYTNEITAYHRAPHIFVGFPARYFDPGGVKWQEQSDWVDLHNHLSEIEQRKKRFLAGGGHHTRCGTALTDSLFMTSRDGKTFKRWSQAFLRPGPVNWAYADNFIAWQLVETDSVFEGAPRELSLYTSEASWVDKPSQLRRYTLRLDGFVSVHADSKEAEMLTKPFIFQGKCLEINYSTSIKGGIKIEIQDKDGNPVPGFTLKDCPLILGDNVDRVVSWNGGTDLRKLAGKPVRLLFTMRDADLYAMRFAPKVPKITVIPKDNLHTRGFSIPKNGLIFTPSGPSYRYSASSLVNRFIKEMVSKSNYSAKKLSKELKKMMDRYCSKEAAFTRKDYVEGVRNVFANIIKSILVIPKTAKPPVIDGKYHPGEWQSSVKTHHFTIVNTGGAPKFGTTAYITYDDKALYFCFVCNEESVKKLICNGKGRDSKTWRDDAMEVVLIPKLETNKVYQFVINAAGKLCDLYGSDMKWNGQVEIATSKNEKDSTWTCETAIPWSNFAITPQPGMILRGNMARDNARQGGAKWNVGNVHSSWCSIENGGIADSYNLGIFILK